jgi:hypothetical protein
MALEHAVAEDAGDRESRQREDVLLVRHGCENDLFDPLGVKQYAFWWQLGQK